MGTNTLIPGRSGWARSGRSGRTRTGTRCTTLVKLPVALSGGRRENRAPVAGDRLSTWPGNRMPGYASTVNSAGSPGFTSSISVSLRFAASHTPSPGHDPLTGRAPPGGPPRLHELPALARFLADDAARWRRNAGIREAQGGLVARGAGRGYT